MRRITFRQKRGTGTITRKYIGYRTKCYNAILLKSINSAKIGAIFAAIRKFRFPISHYRGRFLL